MWVKVRKSWTRTLNRTPKTLSLQNRGVRTALTPVTTVNGATVYVSKGRSPTKCSSLHYMQFVSNLTVASSNWPFMMRRARKLLSVKLHATTTLLRQPERENQLIDYYLRWLQYACIHICIDLTSQHSYLSTLARIYWQNGADENGGGLGQKKIQIGKV